MECGFGRFWHFGGFEKLKKLVLLKILSSWAGTGFQLSSSLEQLILSLQFLSNKKKIFDRLLIVYFMVKAQSNHIKC